LAERAHASFSRYFSPNLAERLASHVNAIDLGRQHREIMTLFSDIAGFTALVERPQVGKPCWKLHAHGL
jgi:adenylate cyclase